MWTKEHYARPEQPGGASGPAGGIQSRSARAGAAGGLPGSRRAAGKATRLGGDAQNEPSVDRQLDQPGPCRATAQCGVRHPHGSALGSGTWRSAGLAPTTPLGWRDEPRFRVLWYPRPQCLAKPTFARLGAHKTPRVGPGIGFSRRLAPTKPLGWRHESGFRVAWHPQNPSNGVTNRGFASLGAPPPGWRRELRLAPFGAHGPARGSGPATPGKDAMV